MQYHVKGEILSTAFLTLALGCLWALEFLQLEAKNNQKADIPKQQSKAMDMRWID